MRTSILTAALLGMFAAACTGSIDDVGGGGDDTGGGPDCGNGVVDTGEACDDGNTLSGDGCSASCATEQSSTPRVSIMVDKPTVTTDLLVNNEVSITVTSVDGFSGDVALAVSTLDAANAAISGWTTELSTTTLTLAEGATQTATLRLRVPGDTVPLTGSVKIAATSTAAAQEAVVAVTANPVVVVPYTTTGNDCTYPIEFPINNPIRIKRERTLRVVNGSANLRMRIHIDAGITGVAHQGTFMNPGAAYEQTVAVGAAPGASATFYCHDADSVPGQDALDAGNMALYQRLLVVD